MASPQDDDELTDDDDFRGDTLTIYFRHTIRRGFINGLSPPYTRLLRSGDNITRKPYLNSPRDKDYQMNSPRS